MKDIYVGLIGFGTVGTGVVKLLADNGELIADKLGARLRLKRIADLDTTTDRGVKLLPGVLTNNVNEILNDPEISIVIELIGGYEPAKSFRPEGDCSWQACRDGKQGAPCPSWR